MTVLDIYLHTHVYYMKVLQDHQLEMEHGIVSKIMDSNLLSLVRELQQ